MVSDAGAAGAEREPGESAAAKQEQRPKAERDEPPRAGEVDVPVDAGPVVQGRNIDVDDEPDIRLRGGPRRRISVEEGARRVSNVGTPAGFGDAGTPNIDGEREPVSGRAAEPRPPEAAAEATGALDCFRAATAGAVLSDSDARELCFGAHGAGPASCARAALDRTPLATFRVLELCRCADSDAPVRCYTDGEGTTDLTELEIVRLCSPVQSLGLGAGCLPAPPYP